MAKPGPFKYVIICCLATVAGGQVLPVVVEPVNEIFLHCLCDALKPPCNHERSCESTASLDVCGPFGIIQGYWNDAGMPVVEEDNSKNREKLPYQTCALDLACAAKTVVQYMSGVRRKDCNSDGVVDAMDYALTHWQGGYGDCSPGNIVRKNDTVGMEFMERFTRCKKKYTVSRNLRG